MIKKAIVAIVVIVAAATLVFAALPSDQKDPTNNSNTTNSSSDIQQNTTQNSNNSIATDNSGSKADNTAISASEAKEIAGKYIVESGAYAGTPKLINENGNLVYSVPVIYNEKIVGEIDINAQTGKNVGGAGGAP